MSDGPSPIRFTASRAVRPWLNYISLRDSYTQKAFDLATRIKLKSWIGPPRAGSEKPTVYRLFPTLSSLTPFDKAKIKLEIAKVLLEDPDFVSSHPGTLPVTIFGTCGRKVSSVGGRDTITGFKFSRANNSFDIEFDEPLVFPGRTDL